MPRYNQRIMYSPEIQSGAVTVAHVADYFEQLKATVQELRQRLGVRERGYCTPCEDEQIHHLLVSYWRSRLALLELVQHLHETMDELDEAQRPAAFLVAYAGAILLVDAARFLRHSVGDSPVIVAKLNEAEPELGIPAHSYDRVQESLTDPRHAWHVYWANEHFRKHEALLRQAGRDPLLGPVLAVIDRLSHRVQVSPVDYAAARLRVQARRIDRDVREEGLGQLVYGVQEWVSRLMADVHLAPHHRPRLPRRVAEQMRQMLRPGDVLITRKEHALTNYFLPGYWPHAALYLGEPPALEQMGLRAEAHVASRWERVLAPADAAPDEPRRVLEALKDGVRVRSIQSPLGSDAVAIIRPRLGSAQIAQALSRALLHEGKPYDFDFDFTRGDRLVCTGVVYRAYDGIGDLRFALSRRVGRLTLAAEDLLGMALRRQHFEPVAAYAPGKTRRLVVGDAVDPLLRVTMQQAGAPQPTL